MTSAAIRIRDPPTGRPGGTCLTWFQPGVSLTLSRLVRRGRQEDPVQVHARTTRAGTSGCLCGLVEPRATARCSALLENGLQVRQVAVHVTLVHESDQRVGKLAEEAPQTLGA